MSDGLNKVLLLGNVGNSPECKHTKDGKSVLALRLATEQSFSGADGNRQSKTEWHDVVIFGARAEGLARVLRRGSRIFVEGSLRTSSWEKDGSKHSRTEVIAYNVLFAGARPRDGDGDGRRAGESDPGDA